MIPSPVTLPAGFLARHVTVTGPGVAQDDNGRAYPCPASLATGVRLWATSPDRRPAAMVAPVRGEGYRVESVR